LEQKFNTVPMQSLTKHMP